MTYTVGTTRSRRGVDRGRSDSDADANTDEEVETRDGGEVGEDKEFIWRGGDDTVDAAGKRGREEGKGQGGGPDKAPTEDRGGTPEGRGEGQSPLAVGGRARPSM